MTANELADKWIKELTEMGFTPDEMIRAIRIAKVEYEKQEWRKAVANEK